MGVKKSIFIWYLIWYLRGFSPQPEDKDTFFCDFQGKIEDTEKIPKVSYLILSYLILSYLSGKIGRTGAKLPTTSIAPFSPTDKFISGLCFLLS
jgi:hypothetical protein